MRDFLKKKFSILFFLYCLVFIFAETSIAATSGEELYEQGKYKEAYDVFTKADMDNPKKIHNRYNRGCAAVKMQDLNAGEAAFTSVLTRTDDSDMRFRAFYNRGITAFNKGDIGSAIDDFKEALKLNPLDEDARFNLELALFKKKSSEQREKEHKNDKDGQDKSQDSSKSKDKEDKTDQKNTPDNKKDNEDSQQNDKKQENNKTDNTGEKGIKQDTKKDKDISGELKGAGQENNTLQKESLKRPEVSGLQIDRNKADALLENVNDDLSILMKAMKKQKKQVGKSGKTW